MPQLPDFTALGERPAPQSAGGIATLDPGNLRLVNLAGQYTENAGRDLEQASSIVAETNNRQDEIVAQSAANQLAQARVQAEFDPTQGFRNVKGGNAVGQPFLDAYNQKFTDAAAQLRDGLQNDNQRRVFDRHAQVEGLQFKSALLQHQARETDTFNDKTADDTANLSLRSMAQNPLNELSFQTEMAKINGAVDSVAKRKGLPPETVADVKAKYLDAAYTTRITAVMQGVPGAVQANPYLAEKMFEQVQGQLGPQAQTQLGERVQKAVQSVQARDTARSFIFGQPAPNPKSIAPAATGSPLQAVVMAQESGGQRYDAQGNLLTSPAGAQGEMQVMPATARDPGYGVRPAQNDSPEELARVGRDYLGAMSARYGDPALTLAAYNAGPGRVDEWIAKYGDPRSGKLTPQEWAQKIPFAETQAYVVNGLKKLASQGGGEAAAINAPTANQLKTDLYQRVQAARDVAERQYPGDTAYADSVAARVEGYGRTVLANVQAQQAGARDTLMMGVIGQAQDGSDKPKTVDQLLADPQMKTAWDAATPETKAALQDRFAKGEKFTQDSFDTYYGLLGKAADSPDEFTQVDLGKYFGQLPDTQLLQLANLQRSMTTKDAKAAARDLNWARAKGSVEDMLKPIGMGATAKANTTRSVQTEQFYGRLNESLQQYHDENNKWPDTQTTRQMAAGLLAAGKQTGRIYDSDTRYFQSPDASQFYVPLPSDSKQLQSLQDSFTKVMGHAPSKAELQNYYTRYRLAGGK